MLFSTESAVKLINSELRKIDLPSGPKNLYEPVSYILGLGGKRLRPLLVLMTHSLYVDNMKAAIVPALAVEVFHNFTLVHDDIMDNAPIRRGKATVHNKWNTNVAILSGDVMLIKAYELLSHVPPVKLQQMLCSFNIIASQVCEGQQMDVDYETRIDVTIEEYLHMITCKTAVLLGFCTELGAALGGSSEKDMLLLKEFGVSIGVAFQLKDDLLDVFGEGSKTGKQVGGDILARKKTFLLIKAMALAKGDDLLFLQAYLKQEKLPEQSDVERIKQIYNRLGLEASANDYIHKYLRNAVAAISKVNVAIYKRKMLRNFVMQLVDREN